ncbi:MAG TPA: beta-propeller domain-containing protein [Verrucomicrobiae bacterium]|nr:beta-propeller domain-containing protein [Verrucomicrobiae bacterium]
MKIHKWLIPIVALALAGSIFAIREPENTGSLAPADPAPELPIVGSVEKLQVLLSEVQSLSGRMRGTGMAAQDSGVAKSAQSLGGTGSNFSQTNVQVEGVDEADIIKTDGKYIYQVNNRRVLITKAFPAAEMQVVNTLSFDANFIPFELYVDASHLVVLGHNTMQNPIPYQGSSSVSGKMIAPLYTQTLKVLIYDLKDREKPQQLREVELEGNYLSSRKIDSALYLVANKYINYATIQQKPEDSVPHYRDSFGQGSLQPVDLNEIRYFPDSVEPNYLMVAALDLNQNTAMQVSTYLGSGQNIYSSEHSLYVAVSKYDRRPAEEKKGIAIDIAPVKDTELYRFELNAGSVKYAAKGEVPGTLLNQFSMDEYQSHLRIAVTEGSPWAKGQNTSRNNLYILDSALQTVGKLEGLAPGESIYSVRFLGGRGYLVTFKQVDPLFVVDLQNPASPKVLGQLKIPGYSNYLHPYDENHIIGFGKDTVEAPPKPGSANMAYYQGMKLALFDVRDVEHPVEKFKEIIGDRGTDSELLHNHKALMFDKTRNLLAFPVSVMKLKNKPANGQNITRYGEFEFQGAYVYNLDLTSGFVLKGRITHADQQNSSNPAYPRGDKTVNRVLYIDDTLYTISNYALKANRLPDLAEEKTILLN